MNISFRVPAVPVAQPRAKATSINGHVRMYEAGAAHGIHAFKATVRMSAAEAYSGEPFTGPLSVALNFVFPTKASKKRVPRTYKATRPDGDNLAKGVLDTLNGLLFKDDGQVVELIVRKWHAGTDEQPHVDVSIMEL